MRDRDGIITPEIASARANEASSRARHATRRARMLAEHGRPEAAEAKRDARGYVYEARFYRARATGETMTGSARHALALDR